MNSACFQRMDWGKWSFFIFLMVVFFLIQHTLKISVNIAAGGSQDLDMVVEFVREGSLARQVALLLLFGVSIVTLVRNRARKYGKIGFLGGLILFYLFWVFASIFWAGEPLLALRKASVLAIFSLAGLAIACRFTERDILHLSFSATLLFLILGIVIEIESGTFHPFLGEYRFSGTLHPNHQGANCAVLLLASAALFDVSSRRKYVFPVVAGFAFLFLVLTKSRAGAAAGVIAYLVLWGFRSSTFKIIGWGIVVTSLLLLLILFFGDSILDAAREVVLLGRGKEQSMDSLSGRIPLWREGIHYFLQRPFQGYGYNAFWTPDKVIRISDSVGWTVTESHSAYLDIALGLGVVGLTAFTLIFLGGAARMASHYRFTRCTEYAFFCSLITYSLFNSILESTILNPEMPVLLNLTILARAGFLPGPEEDTKI